MGTCVSGAYTRCVFRSSWFPIVALVCALSCVACRPERVPVEPLPCGVSAPQATQALQVSEELIAFRPAIQLELEDGTLCTPGSECVEAFEACDVVIGDVAVGEGEAISPIVLCPLVIPIAASGSGAALGFIMSDEEELPSPSIALVVGAAMLGAVVGGVSGAVWFVVPGLFYIGVVGTFVGATIGSAMLAYVTAQQLAIARE